jgi:nucleotide-binding universal stress UspA family protein
VAYVLSPDGFYWAGTFSDEWIRKYKPLSEETLATALEKYADLPIASQTVLVQKSPGIRKQAAGLAKFAKKMKADIIAVQTHARHGWDRWVHGSFTETLIRSSPIPVLSTHQDGNGSFEFDKIFYPTDFSPESERAFRSLLPIARAFESKIVLFHRFVSPVEPLLQNGVYAMGGGWISIQQYMAEDKTLKDQLAQSWVRIAQDSGVPVEVIFDSSTGSTGEVAAHVAGPHLTAIMQESSPVGATLVGSVTRSVLRQAVGPVLVFHSHSK